MTGLQAWGLVAAVLTGAVAAAVIWVAFRLRHRGPVLNAHVPLPATYTAAHDELPGPGARPLYDADLMLLATVRDRWEELQKAGVADRGHAIADLGRIRSDSSDSFLAASLFRTTRVLGTILREAGDPDGHYWAVMLELGAACHDLTALDYTDAAAAETGDG